MAQIRWILIFGNKCKINVVGGRKVVNWHEMGNRIAKWIRDYSKEYNISTLVVGVSGGIDSAVTSTLCAKTGLKTHVLNMPIHQNILQNELASKHIAWLNETYSNVVGHNIDLTNTYDLYVQKDLASYDLSKLSLANTRARLRMTTLYAIAGNHEGLVVGTGNKVEDFGVGFFTKYGDGGVDISPIADLFKSEVYALADALGILVEIQNAPPTDGLWDDGRTDEEQIGATYEELEWAMHEIESPSKIDLGDRKKEVLELYKRLNKNNLHKMKSIPIFRMFDDLRGKTSSRDSSEENR